MDKFIRLFKRFLLSSAAIFNGAIIGSLWINDSETWRDYLPIVLTCLVLERFTNSE